MSCGRTCLPVLVVVLAPLSAWAAPEREPTRLTLSPAPAPAPALKYLLLPELKDQTPGNAALEYYRAFSPEWWGMVRRPEEWEKISNALQVPLKELLRAENPPKEGPRQMDLRWLLGYRMLRQVDLASRREYVDWGMAERFRREGYGLLLPDVQSLRQIGTLLAVRARLEMAEGHLDQALYTLQTGLALARHTGDAVTLIQNLVGIALADMMLARVEELIQQPGAPNLYWALTDLPRPLFDLRKALQGEKMGLYASLPALRDLETARLTPEQQQNLLIVLGGGMYELLGFGPRPTAVHRLQGTALVLRAYPQARQALITQGRKPEEVDALPAVQVVLIHSQQQYRRLQDDLFKWYGLPYWEARPHLAEVDRRIIQARSNREGLPFLEIIPAIQRVVATAVRVDRRVAALRCIEAVRLYAAAHDGKLPGSLSDITEVPIPIDPVTGKAFDYRVSGDRATLSAPPPPGEQAHPSNTLTYELTLRR